MEIVAEVIPPSKERKAKEKNYRHIQQKNPYLKTH